MADRSVAIRLATQGKADVVRDVTQIGDAQEAQAQRWQKAYEKAGDEIDRQIERQAQAAQKMASLTPGTPTQQIYQAGASTNYTGPAAATSAANLRDLLKAEEDLDARAASLKAKLDPLTVAQRAYDAEVRNATELKAAGRIGEDEFAKAVASSGAALAAAKREVEGHSGALSLNRQQFIIGQSAVMRFSDSIIAGQSPLRAFALEAHKVGEVMSVDDDGMAGGIAKVRALLTPMNLAIGASVLALAVGAAAGIDYGNALGKLSAVATGSGAALGLTGQQLEATAENTARAGSITISAARDIETGYLQVAKSGDVLSGLTAITKDYAAATGQDMKAAQGDLAASFADPIDGAEKLTEKYGLLTQAQSDHIAQLVQEGHQEQAQKELLDAIKNAFTGASDQAEGLAASWDHIKSAADRAWVSTGRFFDQYGKGVVNGLLSAAMLPDLDAFGGNSPAGQRGKLSNPAANQARARANQLSAQYQGDNRDSLQKTIGTLQAGINSGGTPDQLRDWTTALAANQHALDTWIPSGQKANEVAAAQAKVAAARGPAAKREAETELALVQSKGEVVTAADAEARAHSRADAAAAHATKTGDKHAQTLAREAASMEVSARAAFDVADAYLKSSSAGVMAEAHRKAATDATKKGIDVDAQARRQLNLQIAEGAATGAKSVASLNDETDARAKVNAAVADGGISVDQLNQALSDQNALRPLIALRDAADGDAKTKLTTIIDAYTAALARSHKEEAVSGLDKDLTDSRNRALEIRAQIADLARAPLDQRLNAAGRAASQEAFAKYGANSTAEQRAPLVRSKEDEALAGYQRDRAQYLKSTTDSQEDSLALSQRELSLAGANDNYRTLDLDKLKLALQIRRQFPDMGEADVQKLMEGVAAQDAINARLKVTAANIAEVQQFGGQFVDDVLSPDTWSSWGNAGKTVLKDIETEFLKLALLNPIKNLINGNSALPTLSGALGSIGSLFGSHSISAASANSSLMSTLSSINIPVDTSLGHNASGTENWSGGRTWVNENGPEIADLPNGTRIYPAAETRRMMTGNDNGGGGNITHNHFTGNLLTPEFWAQIQAGDDGAATRGAAGGAAIGQAQTMATKKRQLGRAW